MRRVELALQRCVIASVLLALACGDDDSADVPLYRESFEDACGDTPCGWSIVQPSDGTARYVETIHAGEHGIALEGDDVIVRADVEDARGVATFMLGSLQALVVARCDATSTLRLRVALASRGDAAAGPSSDALEANINVGTETLERATVALMATTGLRDGGFGSTPVATDVEILGVSFEKDGPGRCEIADIIVDDYAFMFTDPGCD